MTNNRAFVGHFARHVAFALGAFGVLLFLSLQGAVGQAYADPVDYSYKVVNGGAVITGYSGTEKRVDIPEDFDGFPVTRIAEHAFYNRPFDEGHDDPETFEENKFTLVTIPKTVTKIDELAFYNNHQLKSVEFDGNPKLVIGSSAFTDCGLTQVTLPKGTRFGKAGLDEIRNPFSGNPIKRFKSPGNPYLKVVGNGKMITNAAGTKVLAFAGASVTGSYAIPSGITTVGYAAFEGASITGLTMGDSVKTIETGAFSDCRKLVKVSLGKNVTKLESYAFKDCRKLRAFGIPAASKLKTIEAKALYNCPVLRSIRIPAGVKTIGEYALGIKCIGGIEGEDDSPVAGFCMTVAKNSAAYRYAKSNDLNYVGETKVYKLEPQVGALKATATKAAYVSASKNAYKYQFAYRLHGAKKWKMVKSRTQVVTLKKLLPTRRYEVKVRAIKKANGEVGYGTWSVVKLSAPIKAARLTSGSKS